jgi:hypothetical protein
VSRQIEKFSVYQIIIFLLFSSSPKIFSQMHVEWLNTQGGPQNQTSEYIACDDNNNIYVYGRFNNQISIPPFQFNQPAGSFLSKYDVEGNMIWLRTFSNLSIKGIHSNSNKIFLFGGYSGRTEIGNISLESNGEDDALLITINSEGQTERLWEIKGPEHEYICGLDTDLEGNQYLITTISNQTRLGDETFQLNNQSVLVIKSNSSGTILWKQLIRQNKTYVMAKDLRVSDDGEKIFLLAMAGSENTSGLQDKITFSNSSVSYFFANGYGYVLASLDKDGIAQYVTGFYGENHYSAGHFESDKHNNIYLCGSSYYSGYHITKYSPTLEFLWQKNVYFETESWFYNMCVTREGDIYTTGNFTGELKAEDQTFTSNQSSLFLLKHDKDGHFRTLIKGIGNESSGSDITLGIDENLIMTGFYKGTLLLQNKTVHASDYDFFIAKISTNLVSNIPAVRDIENISIFPNPSAGRIFINHNEPTKYTLLIYAANGTCVYMAHNATSVDLNHLSSGTYIVNIQTPKKSVFQKIILAK